MLIEVAPRGSHNERDKNLNLFTLLLDYEFSYIYAKYQGAKICSVHTKISKSEYLLQI